MPSRFINAPASPSPNTSLRLTTLVSACAMALTFILSYLLLNSPFVHTQASLSSAAEPSPSSPPCPQFPSELNTTHHRPDIPLAPSPLPPPHASSDANLIIPLLLSLTRSSTFNLISSIPLLAPDTFEPEGALLLGSSHLIISSGEYTSPTVKYPDGPINGTDRSPGAGIAHIQVFHLPSGELIADASLTNPTSLEYHNGGIDYDGHAIYGTASQYRPNSSATIYTLDPTTLRPTPLIHHPSDHLGTIVINPSKKTLTAMNWGSRTADSFSLPEDPSSCSSTPPTAEVKNPSHFIDYQDCKFLGPHEDRDVAICSGVTSLSDGAYVLGGIALVDVDSMQPVFELPITLESKLGVRITMNPFDVAVVDGRLRFYWVPDQHNSTLYVYEAQP